MGTHTTATKTPTASGAVMLRVAAIKTVISAKAIITPVNIQLLVPTRLTQGSTSKWTCSTGV